MQYAKGIAHPTRHIFYGTGRGPSGTEDWYLSWLGFILCETIIPQTISISYGNYEKVYSRKYAGYVCLLFYSLACVASRRRHPRKRGQRRRRRELQKTALETYAPPPLPRNLYVWPFYWLASSTQRASIQRWWRSSLTAASWTTFCARTTRSRPSPPSYRTLATSIRACTTLLAAEFLISLRRQWTSGYSSVAPSMSHLAQAARRLSWRRRGAS